MKMKLALPIILLALLLASCEGAKDIQDIPTIAPTPTYTLTPWPTLTPTPTETPTPEATATETPVPTETFETMELGTLQHPAKGKFEDYTSGKVLWNEKQNVSESSNELGVSRWDTKRGGSGNPRLYGGNEIADVRVIPADFLELPGQKLYVVGFRIKIQNPDKTFSFSYLHAGYNEGGFRILKQFYNKNKAIGLCSILDANVQKMFIDAGNIIGVNLFNYLWVDENTGQTYNSGSLAESNIVNNNGTITPQMEKIIFLGGPVK